MNKQQLKVSLQSRSRLLSHGCCYSRQEDSDGDGDRDRDGGGSSGSGGGDLLLFCLTHLNTDLKKKNEPQLKDEDSKV